VLHIRILAVCKRFGDVQDAVLFLKIRQFAIIVIGPRLQRYKLGCEPGRRILRGLLTRVLILAAERLNECVHNCRGKRGILRPKSYLQHKSSGNGLHREFALELIEQKGASLWIGLIRIKGGVFSFE
jgi:hypothetical protein